MSTARPKILVITGYGINCEEETAKCFNWAGGDAEIVHINDLINTPNLLSSSPAKKLSNYQIIAFPGGFSYGDDTGSGNALANKIRNNLKEDLLTFLKEDKLIIGICNGMQIMANLGLIPATDMEKSDSTSRSSSTENTSSIPPTENTPGLSNTGNSSSLTSTGGQPLKHTPENPQINPPTPSLPPRQAALMRNLHVSLECRWIHVKNISKKCIWTRDIDMMHLPIAHGEGNFYVEPEILARMKAQDQIVFKFVNEDGSSANQKFPANPNGALEDITGVCDPSGRIFAMMPHPERFNSWTNEDGWEVKKEKLVREHLAKTLNLSPDALTNRSHDPLVDHEKTIMPQNHDRFTNLAFPPEGDGLQIFRNGVNYFT